jgi:hypothetical protein
LLLFLSTGCSVAPDLSARGRLWRRRSLGGQVHVNDRRGAIGRMEA